MQSHTDGPRVCENCGSLLQSGYRFCPNCGVAVSPGGETIARTPEPDPSTLETSEHEPISPGPEPAPGPSPYDTTYQDAGHPTWGTPETTVPPESGNRTLWIILGIIAFIVLICCCLLPLILAATSYVDTALQDDIRSAIQLALS